jgi:hypothetical protein
VAGLRPFFFCAVAIVQDWTSVAAQSEDHDPVRSCKPDLGDPVNSKDPTSIRMIRPFQAGLNWRLPFWLDRVVAWLVTLLGIAAFAAMMVGCILSFGRSIAGAERGGPRRGNPLEVRFSSRRPS